MSEQGLNLANLVLHTVLKEAYVASVPFHLLVIFRLLHK